MMTVKQTEGVGWRFVMGSLAIGLSPLAFPVIDYIIVEFVGTLAVLMLGAALPVSIAPGIALTEVVVTAIGALGTNPAGWGVLIFIICVLICMILFIFFAAAFGYFFTPFIFIRLLSSGDVASQMSGAFSNMTGHSSSILRSGIEGAEAGARSIKLANAKVGEQEAIAQVAQRADVPNDIASIAYKNSGGRIQDAISMASQMDKQRFTTPSGTYKAEPMPVGVKKTI